MLLAGVHSYAMRCDMWWQGEAKGGDDDDDDETKPLKHKSASPSKRRGGGGRSSDSGSKRRGEDEQSTTTKERDASDGASDSADGGNRRRRNGRGDKDSKRAGGGKNRNTRGGRRRAHSSDSSSGSDESGSDTEQSRLRPGRAAARSPRRRPEGSRRRDESPSGEQMERGRSPDSRHEPAAPQPGQGGGSEDCLCVDRYSCEKLGFVGQLLYGCQANFCYPVQVCARCGRGAWRGALQHDCPGPFGLMKAPVFSPDAPRPSDATFKAHDKDVLRVEILGADSVIDDPRVLHPMIRMHVIDAATGTYIRKVGEPCHNSTSA